MKPTKRILKLAEKIVTTDLWMDDPEHREQYIANVTDTLTQLKKALIKGDYYTGVESVSKSGMSRVISIRWMKDGRLYYAPDYVYKLAGCDKNRRITGCGMDMLFAAQYNLFVQLCDRKRLPYQSHMARYRTL